LKEEKGGDRKQVMLPKRRKPQAANLIRSDFFTKNRVIQKPRITVCVSSETEPLGLKHPSHGK
jgi:hypothetical protein